MLSQREINRVEVLVSLFTGTCCQKLGLVISVLFNSAVMRGGSSLSILHENTGLNIQTWCSICLASLVEDRCCVIHLQPSADAPPRLLEVPHQALLNGNASPAGPGHVLRPRPRHPRFAGETDLSTGRPEGGPSSNLPHGVNVHRGLLF